MGRRSSRLRQKIRQLLSRLWPGSGNGTTTADGHHLRRKKMRVREHRPNLQFSISSTWAWSLKVYNEHAVVGVMQAASPLACLAVVEPYFRGGGEPVSPYRLMLCCNSNHRQLKLDRASFRRLDGASSDEPTPELLRVLAHHFERDPEAIGDSTCVTVMTDADNEVVDSRALLSRVFGVPVEGSSGPHTAVG